MERFRIYKSSFLFWLMSAILLFAFITPVKTLAATYTVSVDVYYDTAITNGVVDPDEQGFANGNIVFSPQCQAFPTQCPTAATTKSTGLATITWAPVATSGNGNYAVAFTNIPAGYRATTSNPVIVTISAATPNPTVNFGIAPIPTPTPTISDTTPPTLSSIAVASITNTSANISWNVSEPATGQVEYGTSTSYGTLSTLETNLLTFHNQKLSNLLAGTTYHYRVRSKDAAGNLAISQDATFKTTGGATPTPTPTATATPTPTPTPKPATPTPTPTPKPATPTPTPTPKPATPTPTPVPSSGNYGVTSKYCPQGNTSGTFCGKTSCDNAGVDYIGQYGYDQGNCTYHSWDCSGTGSKTCGPTKNSPPYAHYWSQSCDLTNTQRNLGDKPNGRCLPPRPASVLCALNPAKTGYVLTWPAVTHSNYNVYTAAGVKLTANSISAATFPIALPTATSYIVRSIAGDNMDRENPTGRTSNICPTIPTPTPTATPTPKPATPTPTATPTLTPTPTPTPVPRCNGGQVPGSCTTTQTNSCSANNGTMPIKYTTYNGSTNCQQYTIYDVCTVNNCNFGNLCVSGTCVAPTPTPTPPTATPTLTPTATPTGPGPTPTPTPTSSPTPTPVPNTNLSIVLGMDGIWSTGDNANPDPSGSNKNPLHTTRNVRLKVYNASNAQVLEKTGIVTYQTTGKLAGTFTGTISLGNFTGGPYTIKVSSDGHLAKQLPGIFNFNYQDNYADQVNLVAGDVNNDNALTILDYNIFLSCSIYTTDSKALCNSNSNYPIMSDVDDNGTVDQFDYNLFVREYSVQNGQ